MSKVMYKQWIEPNKRSAVIAASNMMGYIATREGVEIGCLTLEKELEGIIGFSKEERQKYMQYIATRPGAATDGKPHGLFGKLAGMKEADDIADLERTRAYAQDLAQENKTIYHAVISLKEEDALDRDIVTRADWAQLTEESMNEIIRIMDLRPRTVEWVASVHIEKGHPHVHLMYWDKAQTVGVNFISPEKANTIRKQLTKNLYKEDIKELLAQKDTVHKSFLDQLYRKEDSILANPKNAFQGLHLAEIYQLTHYAGKRTKLLDRRIADKNVSMLVYDLITLKDMLKIAYPTGALKYNYLPEEMKTEVNRIAQTIIANNPDIAKNMYMYLDIVKEHAALFGGEKNSKDYIDKAQKALYKEIGNQILSAIKDFKHAETAANETHYTDKMNRIAAVGLMQAIFDIIVVQDVPKPPQKKLNRDMSKAQKSELVKQTQDNGAMEWGD